MNNYFFTSIGLENMDIGIILTILASIILILLILNIVNMCLISKLKKKYKKFMNGKNANSLENEIIALFEDNKFIKSSIEKNKKDIRTLYHKFESSFQKIGIIKYDAFSQIGGKLSFCLALLDENNNGFILNSVHSTDGCYSYTKEIKNGECKNSLSDEEIEALQAAIEKKYLHKTYVHNNITMLSRKQYILKS